MPDYTWEQLGSQAANFDLGKSLANAGRTAICGIYNNAPGWLTYRDGGFGDPSSQFAKGFWDTVCADSGVPLPAPPTVPFSGGQCVAAYNIDLTIEFETFFDGVSTGVGTRTDLFGAEGAIRPAGLVEFDNAVYWRYYTAIGGSGGVNGVEQNYAVVQLVNPANPRITARLISFTINSVTRQDGLPDNCGDPPPGYDDIRPPSSVVNNNLTINVEISDGLTINVPVTINDNSIDNSVNINLSPDFGIDLNFGLPGVDVGYPGRTINVTNVDLDPVLDAVTQVNRDLIDYGGTIQDIWENRLLIEPNTIVVAGCDEGTTGQLQVPSHTIKQANGASLANRDDVIFAELYNLRTEGKIKCRPQTEPSVILEGDTLEQAGIFFTSVFPPQSIGFLVQILTFDPAFIRTYKLSESSPEAGFGNAALVSSDGAAVGDFTRVWLADTFIPAWDCRIPHGLRLSLKRGITFRVVSLGYNPLLFDGW